MVAVPVPPFPTSKVPVKSKVVPEPLVVNPVLPPLIVNEDPVSVPPESPVKEMELADDPYPN